MSGGIEKKDSRDGQRKVAANTFEEEVSKPSKGTLFPIMRRYPSLPKDALLKRKYPKDEMRSLGG